MSWKGKDWWVVDGMFEIEIIEVLRLMVMALTKWLKMENQIIAGEMKEARGKSNTRITFLYSVIIHPMTGDPGR